MHWADYLIFVAFLAISIGIGIFFAFTGGKQKTTEEFIMANRKLRVLPTAISLIVSYKSALTIVGAPAEMYKYGLMYWPFQCIKTILGGIVIAEVFVPWLYPLKLTSMYSYFLLRYKHRGLQIFSTLLGVVTAMLYCGAAIYAPSIAMETVAGIPTYVTVPVTTVVCVLYTSLGGMKAVIWTDVFQFLIIIAGQLAILVKSTLMAGGMGAAFRVFSENDRARLSFSADPSVRHTFWNLIIGGTILTAAINGLTQSSVQRFSAVPTYKEARRIPYIMICGSVTISSLAYLSGITIVAYYHNMDCDPMAAGIITSSNQILPHFVLEAFKDTPGFLGLFVATLYSATLSTVSSVMAGMAANIWDDIIKPLYPKISESKATNINKGLIILVGVVVLGISFLVQSITNVPIIQITISLLSLALGPTLAVLFVGGIRPLKFVSWQSSLSGALLGFAFILWIFFGSLTVKGKYEILPPWSIGGCFNGTSPEVYLNKTIEFVNGTMIPYVKPWVAPTGINKFYSMSFQWYIFFGGLVAIFLSIVVELITRPCTRKCGRSEPIDFEKLNPDVFMRPNPACRRRKRVDSSTQTDIDGSFKNGAINVIDNSTSF